MELTYEKGLIAAFGICEEHKLTEEILRAGFQTANIDYKYHIVSMEEKSLEEAVKTVRFLNMHGFQVEKSFQKKVLPYLDDLSLVAKITGQANVVANHDGVYVGENTEAKGLVTCMMFRDMVAQNHTFIIEGKDETAAVAMVELAVSGADKIYICTENEEAIDAYRKNLQKEADTEILWIPPVNPLKIPEDVDIIVHAGEAFEQASGRDCIANSDTNPNASQELIRYDGIQEKMILCNMQLFHDEDYRAMAEAAEADFIDAKEIFFHKIRLHFSLWTEHFIELSGMQAAMEKGLAELTQNKMSVKQEETSEEKNGNPADRGCVTEPSFAVFQSVLHRIPKDSDKIQELLEKKALAWELAREEQLPEEDWNCLEVAVSFSVISDLMTEEELVDLVWNTTLSSGYSEEIADRSLYMILHYKEQQDDNPDLDLQILWDTDVLWKAWKKGQNLEVLFTKSGGKMRKSLIYGSEMLH